MEVKQAIKKDIKVFNAINKGIQNVMDKAGVDNKMLVAMVCDGKPMCMVGISDNIRDKEFVRAIRDLVYAHYGDDVEQFVDDFADILEQKTTQVKL